ncbi:MAG: phosphoribosyltransferase [Chloroflexi bacterium]|nr:phosphoribosyltransferase [Chloroflexota bacterium]
MSPKQPLRHEILSWQDVDKIVDVLVPQIRSAGSFDAMILITRGGIVPGGLLAEALEIPEVLTAAVSFLEDPHAQDEMKIWPRFLQFPDNTLLRGRQILTVDDVWGSGRTSTAVRSRAEAAGAIPYTCVFHFNPYRSLFSKAEPDFYGAVTDAYVVYPWETDRGLLGISTFDPSPLGSPESN